VLRLAVLLLPSLLMLLGVAARCGSSACWSPLPPGLRGAIADSSVSRRWPVAAAAATTLLQVVGWQQAALGDDSAAASTSGGASEAGMAELLNGQMVYAITDKSGSPALEPDTEGFGNKLVGKFYMDAKAAEKDFERIKKEREGIMDVEIRQLPLSEVYLPFIVNGDEKELGGQLRLEPIAKEVRHAQQILDGMSLGEPGTVPLFMVKQLELQGAESSDLRFTPAFLYEKDLRDSLKRAGAKPQSQGGPKVQVTTLRTITDLYMKSGAKTPRVRVVGSTDNIKDLQVPTTAAAK